jgi:hypothetical protein
VRRRKPPADKAEAWTPSQLERKAQVEAGRAVVASFHSDHALILWADNRGRAVWVDRSGDWGNPYQVDEDGTREEVIAWHREYFARKRSLHPRIPELKGNVLVCWCHPKACHGDYLAALANGEERL